MTKAWILIILFFYGNGPGWEVYRSKEDCLKAAKESMKRVGDYKNVAYCFEAINPKAKQ